MGTERFGGRVLVVDDDRVNRTLLTGSLDTKGTACAARRTAPRPLELLHDDPCDVVLLDIVMPRGE